MTVDKDKNILGLSIVLDETIKVINRSLEGYKPDLSPREIGTIKFVGDGIVRVDGLPNVKSEELVRFPGGLLGMAYNLDPDEVGIILLDESEFLEAGDEAHPTGRVLDVPVGEALMGRVIDAAGRPLDEMGMIPVLERRPVERRAPAIMSRAPVNRPLQTGIKVIDSLIPIGRGQRELILGDRQTGKTAIAVDTIINQKADDVICIYCGIGKQKASIAKVIADLKRHDALERCIIVMTSGDDPPGLQYIAPYAATTIGEYFMEQGKDVLIVYDDLTWHARAYRELALLLRRPPGREAYPGDIFYIHARLLERSTQLKSEYGGGSLTALPIIETQAQNISAYIPTNLISITDGQIYLSPVLFQKGILPAVDVGKSVSRVGGKAQLAAYRAVANKLRLSYTQFQELEAFSRFSTRLDEATRKTIEHGRRVREVMKQVQYEPLKVEEQISILLATVDGLLDECSIEQIEEAEMLIRKVVTDEYSELCNRINAGKKLEDEDRQKLLNAMRQEIKKMMDKNQDADK
ncbi:MAG TPA: alternate F1F0 ATPase, F1 subunit alpha [Balneolales bacterium]|nr:alternate F1F0 ATPase, F1 subunit alpha [Balneolales bacterium]